VTIVLANLCSCNPTVRTEIKNDVSQAMLISPTLKIQSCITIVMYCIVALCVLLAHDLHQTILSSKQGIKTFICEIENNNISSTDFLKRKNPFLGKSIRKFIHSQPSFITVSAQAQPGLHYLYFD
jgi:hypothetical protein